MADDKKRVKLLSNVSKMKADDRLRYYLGLPQDYPVNPKLAKKAEDKILKRVGDTGRAGEGHGVEGSYKNKPTALEAALIQDLSDARWSLGSDRRRAKKGQAADAHYTGTTPYDFGFRNVDEGVAKARRRIAKERIYKRKNPVKALSETP